MPYDIYNIDGTDLYGVVNTDNGNIKSYGSTLDNAKKQVRLLYMLENMKGGIIDTRQYKDYPKLQGGSVINRFRPWNWFCHKKAKDLGITYSCAIVNQQVKEEYRELKKNPNFNIDWLIKNYNDVSKSTQNVSVENVEENEITKLIKSIKETSKTLYTYLLTSLAESLKHGGIRGRSSGTKKLLSQTIQRFNNLNKKLSESTNEPIKQIMSLEVLNDVDNLPLPTNFNYGEFIKNMIKIQKQMEKNDRKKALEERLKQEEIQRKIKEERYVPPLIQPLMISKKKKTLGVIL